MTEITGVWLSVDWTISQDWLNLGKSAHLNYRDGEPIECGRSLAAHSLRNRG
jgi:hypothetical protein